MKNRSINSFLIVASPRSGSNYLCNLLNAQSTVKCYLELFHPDAVPLCIRTLKNFKFRLRPQDRDSRPDEFVDRVFRAPRVWQKQYNMVGAKLLLSPHQIDHGAAALLKRVNKIILLERRNKLAWLASLKVAEKTGEWFTRPRINNRSKAEFNSSELKSRLEDEVQLFNSVINKISINRHKLIRIFYEDLASQTCLDEISNFLEIPKIQLTSETAWETAGGVLSSFSNASEVLRYAEVNGYKNWL